MNTLLPLTAAIDSFQSEQQSEKRDIHIRIVRKVVFLEMDALQCSAAVVEVHDCRILS